MIQHQKKIDEASHESQDVRDKLVAAFSETLEDFSEPFLHFRDASFELCVEGPRTLVSYYAAIVHLLLQLMNQKLVGYDPCSVLNLSLLLVFFSIKTSFLKITRKRKQEPHQFRARFSSEQLKGKYDLIYFGQSLSF
jgi:hypothetical protein